MKRSQTILLGLAFLLLAAALIIAISPSSKQTNQLSSSHSPQKSKTNPKQASAQKKRPHSPPTSASHRVRNQPTTTSHLTKEERNAIIETIQDASTSYDPKELPVIQPYLESPDPLLREAAVNAMIVLGDAAAAPMLRAAAQKMSSPEESKKMNDAADYIELPPANLKQISELFKKRKKENSKTDQ
jgi:hypothetical protein